jgi:hypothetical protein
MAQSQGKSALDRRRRARLVFLIGPPASWYLLLRIYREHRYDAGLAGHIELAGLCTVVLVMTMSSVVMLLRLRRDGRRAASQEDATGPGSDPGSSR